MNACGKLEDGAGTRTRTGLSGAGFGPEDACVDEIGDGVLALALAIGVGGGVTCL